MRRKRRKRHGKKQKKLLLELFKIHNGKCTGCGDEVALACEMQSKGWEIYPQKGVLVSPEGLTVSIASVEHIEPVCKGGAYTLENTTLFCELCNRRTSILHDPGYRKTNVNRYFAKS